MFLKWDLTFITKKTVNILTINKTIFAHISFIKNKLCMVIASKSCDFYIHSNFSSCKNVKSEYFSYFYN